MTSTEQPFKKIAVLIDGDNTSSKHIDAILTQITSLGSIGCKKIYGDFKQGSLSNWDDLSLKLLLEQVHIPAYVKGKNATDIALAIDAIDLSYLDYDCFCIVSSDSDFSLLAKNLRTKHKKVFGFGKSTTIESFKMACDDYFVIDNPPPPIPKIQTVAASQTKQIPSNQTQTTTKTVTPVPAARLKQDTALLNACRDSIQSQLEKNGWAHFSKVVAYLSVNFPKISPKPYGYAKWRSLFNQLDIFEIENHNNVAFIRQKKGQKSTVKEKNTSKLLVNNKQLMNDAIEIITNYIAPIDGWMHIGQFGSQLKAKGHDPKSYGYKSFTQLAENINNLVIKKEQSAILVKIKE